MFELSSEDSHYLKHSIEIGEVLLVLGAGASKTSTNQKNEEVKLASALAETIAARAALPYGGENLSEVLSAVKGNYLRARTGTVA